MEAMVESLLWCGAGVHPSTMQAIIRVESGFNPFAIGVVGGRLQWQPRSAGEALATTRELRRRGVDFSVGLAQINQRNFARLGLSDWVALDPCANLRAAAQILRECYERATRAPKAPAIPLEMALSCYYSGNFTTGFSHGYVQRVMGAATSAPGSSTRKLEQK